MQKCNYCEVYHALNHPLVTLSKKWIDGANKTNAKLTTAKRRQAGKKAYQNWLKKKNKI